MALQSLFIRGWKQLSAYVQTSKTILGCKHCGWSCIVIGIRCLIKTYEYGKCIEDS